MTRSTKLFVLLISQVALVLGAESNSTSLTADNSIFDSTNGINLGGCILAVIAVLIGGGLVVFGYRFLYETMFAIGFAGGAVSITFTADSMLVDKSWYTIGVWIAFVFGGVLCGSMALWVHPKSDFISGVAGGIALAAMVTNSTAYYIFPGHTYEVYRILCVLFGVVFGACDLKYGKPVEIVGISIFGAATLVWGISYFVGDFPFPNNLEKYAEKSTNGTLVYSIPTVWWAYLGGIVVIAAFGMLIQFRKTGRSMIDDELAGFRPYDIGNPDAGDTYNESDKQRGTSPVLDRFADATRESDFLSSSRRSAAHESFCRLYSTEAESTDKMRAKFLEARAESQETETPFDTRSSWTPPSSRGGKKEVHFKEEVK